MKANVLPGRSYLVTSREDAEAILQTSELIDQTRIESEGLPVKELRQLLSTVVETPFGATRTLALFTADKLTPILQTTLLKLIEEPPLYLQVVLQTQRPDALLATIRSRCHTVMGKAVYTNEEELPNLETILQKNRQEAIEILERLRRFYLKPGNLDGKILEITDQSIRKLERNCNVKLTLDHFLLRYQVLSGME